MTQGRRLGRAKAKPSKNAITLSFIVFNPAYGPDNNVTVITDSDGKVVTVINGRRYNE